jgi:hypothetical protein
VFPFSLKRQLQLKDRERRGPHVLVAELGRRFEHLGAGKVVANDNRLSFTVGTLRPLCGLNPIVPLSHATVIIQARDSVLRVAYELRFTQGLLFSTGCSVFAGAWAYSAGKFSAFGSLLVAVVAFSWLHGMNALTADVRFRRIVRSTWHELSIAKT